MKIIDKEKWNRKALYENFIQFDDPFFNICADVNVTALKNYAQANSVSFFIISYFNVLRAVNRIEEFKYRIRENEVIVHEEIRGSCPIMKSDRTFGYGYFDYSEDLDAFIAKSSNVINRVKAGEPFDPKFDEDDLIHSSVIPWASFRSIEHAKRLNKGDSIPKIVTGKLYQRGDDFLMPVSVSGHHALMDGLHAGEFFQLYEELSREFS